MNRLARFSAILLGVLVAAVVLVPTLAATDPLAIGDVLATRLVPPGSPDALGRFHLLGDCAHWPQYERAETYNHLTSRFLRGEPIE